MFKKIVYGILTLFGLILTLGSSGAYGTNVEEAEAPNGPIKLVLVNWDSEIASSNVLAETFRRAGFDPELVSVESNILWESIANGEADATTAVWLPVSNASQYKEYKDRVDLIGTNLDDARTGLAVPTYMAVDSIDELTDEAGKAITGIEPGSGVVNTTNEVLKAYDNLSDWTMSTSSGGAMATLLGQAINKHEEVVVTAWTPHWKFLKYDLKFLDDPKGLYGSESIYTMARQGLKEDNPKAYSILKNFHWTTDQSAEMMLKVHDGAPVEEAASDFLDDHPELYEEWTKDL